MSKKLYSISVRGKQHQWCFDVYVDPSHVQDWRDDGLQIDEIVNTIPEWVVDLGLLRLWCFVQDCFHFRNPFSGGPSENGS